MLFSISTLLTSGASVLLLAAMVSTDPVHIGKFTVPNYAEYHGYSGTNVGKFLRERIRLIAQEAGTDRVELLSEFHNDASASEVLVDSLQLGGLVDAVQEFLDMQIYRISGNILLDNGEMKLVSRVETATDDVFYLSVRGGRDIPTLINKMAELFVERVDPYILSLYHFRKEYPSGNFERAMPLVEHCISVLPTAQKQWPMLLKGHMEYRTGQYEKAVATYQNILSLEPNFAFAWARWGEALIAMGDVEGGLEKMGLAVKQANAEAIIFQLFGENLVKNGQSDAARDVYVRGLKRTPDDPGLQTSLARLYLKHGQYDPALALLEKAVLKNNEDVETHILLTQALEGVISQRRAEMEYVSQ